MVVNINDKALLKLYETGTSRKLKLSGIVVEKFLAVIQKIESAEIIQDLRSDKGMVFERLRGSTNKFSFQLAGHYCLEAMVDWKNKENTVGDFTLLTISNHYA